MDETSEIEDSESDPCMQRMLMAARFSGIAEQIDDSDWEAVKAYLRGLKPGERVVETGVSGMQHRLGTVYHDEAGSVCVRWDQLPGEGGQMSTAVTGGARRILKP